MQQNNNPKWITLTELQQETDSPVGYPVYAIHTGANYVVYHYQLPVFGQDSRETW